MSAALIAATSLLLNNMNRNALTISVGFDDHVSTYIVDRDVVAACDRNLGANDLKDILLNASEDILEGDQGELFLDVTEWAEFFIDEFWLQFDELVD